MKEIKPSISAKKCKDLTVLSLFDGISCGQIALERAGIKVKDYYVSEIDVKAIKVCLDNFPETKQLGCIIQLDPSNLPEIDLLLAGFPCQAWSGLGKQKGLKDPRGSLFLHLIRIYNYLKQQNEDLEVIFENVKMKEEFLHYITDLIGILPVLLNSAKVTAQMRKRYYWSTAKLIPPLEDLHIPLSSILDNGYVNRPKSWCMLESWNRFPKQMQSCKGRFARSMMPIVFNSPDFDWNKGFRPLNRTECERLQTVPEGYTRSVKEQEAKGLLGNGWTVDVIVHILNAIYL